MQGELYERSEGATGREDLTQRMSHGSIAYAALQPPHCESPASGDVHLMAQAVLLGSLPKT